jgi:hypothetical protein
MIFAIIVNDYRTLEMGLTERKHGNIEAKVRQK